MKQNKDTVYITSLEVENVKRVEAVKIEITDALTVIGGNNGQGKSSILDAIRWALGGEKFRPSNPVRAGAEKVKDILRLSNGMIVERVGKNGALRVTTKDGRMGGQQLLSEFIHQFALDIQGFMDQSDKEKAKTLLKILDVDLDKIDALEKKAYDERTDVGRHAERAKAYLSQLKRHEGVGLVEVAAGDLVAKIQAAMEHNQAGSQLESQVAETEDGILAANDEVVRCREALAKAEANRNGMQAKLVELVSALEQFEAIDTDAMKQQIQDLESTNAKVRENQKWEDAATQSEVLTERYNALSAEIEQIRAERLKLLDSAKMPLKGLSVEGGELVFNAQRWDCMSHSEQLRVATSICRALAPKMGFVLIDKLEAMDINTLKEFAKHLESEGIQAITTRVSTGPECSFIIEEGKVKP